MTHEDRILDDIDSNHRLFLPGPPRDRTQTAELFGNPILVGGLTDEEADLMLSALPYGATQLWAEPLDKGLSGSKVFAVRFNLPGQNRRSKPFVMKVGELWKIDRETLATETLAAPLLAGVELPVVRRGELLGMIAQEYRGLRERSNLVSLRNTVRSSPNGSQFIRTILAERLAPWYEASHDPNMTEFTVRELFEPYRSKGPSGRIDDFPPPWSDLHEWVHGATGCTWSLTPERLEELRNELVNSPKTIVHGDLHSQNVLVDQATNECWPIDFFWTRDDSSPVVDLTMLECSLKFLAIPMRSDLRSLLPVELALTREPMPDTEVRQIPYSDEINRVVRAVSSIRQFAIEDVGLDFTQYQICLLMMTYLLATHPGLNTPYLLSSLQILSDFV